MKDKVKWLSTTIRTTKKYLAFLIFQLVLSTSIIFIAIFHKQSFRSSLALGLEYFLIFCMFLDLFNSEDAFFKSKGNILDSVIFILFIAIVATVTIVPDDNDQFQLDDILILSAILARYLIQIIRLIYMIKNSKQAVMMTQQMKQIDFNKKQQANASCHTQQIQMQQSQIMKGHIMRIQQGHIKLNEQI